MKSKTITLFSIILIFSAMILSIPISYQSPFGGFIPPTPSFKIIKVGLENVTALNYTSFTTFIAGGNMSITADYLSNTITFVSTGGVINTLESLTNVTNTGCAFGQTIKVNGTGWWICANDNDSGSSITTLESLTNVTDTGCALNQVRKVDAFGVWICANDNDSGSSITTLESLTNVTDTGCALNQVRKASGGQWVCADDSSGASVLDDLTDVIITLGSYGDILFHNGVTWVDRTFMINTKTCSGTDKISSIDNQTGNVICTTDATGAGGSGIPLPPKKWGELIPRSASTDTIGLVVGCTILGTASYVYDLTDNSGAILSTTAVTDGKNGGIFCTSANFNVFRGDQNSYMYSKWEAGKITTNRLFIGFTSGSILLPNNADTILDSLIGVGLCIRTTDTIYQFCRNDGDVTTDYVSTGITEDAGGVHTFEVYTTDAGVNWCGKIDGGSATCWTTEIPTPTTRLYAESTGETDGGATAILWTQYLWYLQNDK